MIATTLKQQAALAAIEAHPRKEGEGKTQYAKRLAGIAGLHWYAIYTAIQILECEAIGAAARAEEDAERKSRRQVVKFDGDALITKFNGWPNVFARLEYVAKTYRAVAEQRGEIWASSFLTVIAEQCDKAQDRAFSDQQALLTG
jgi:hypothetical protein